MKPNHPLRIVARTLVRQLPPALADHIRDAKRSVLNRRSAAVVFRDIYIQNGWDGTESVSGPGSALAAAGNVRAALPALLSKLGVQSLLDVPCGDAHWISTCLPRGIRYVGGDIVPEIVERNKKDRSTLGEFAVLNLICDPLPAADLILVRDCFIHLPNAMVKQAIENIKQAPVTYLLTTTFPGEQSLLDIELGGYRPVNLTHETFGLRQPIKILFDEDGVRKNGKSLGLWRVSDL